MNLRAIAIAFLLVSCDRQSEVQTVTVQPVTFERTITAEGTLQAEKATPITAPNDAPMPLKVAWLAEDGARLKKGDLVVKFDATDFKELLVAGQNDASTATNKIVKSGVESGATKSNLKRDAAVARSELLAAERFRALDDEAFSRYQQIESSLDASLAAERRDYAEDVLGVRDSIARADRELLDIEMRKAGLKIRNAEQGLNSLEVRAPHDGLLVLRRVNNETFRVGSTAWPGLNVGEIPDLSKMKAEIFVLEADAAGLEVGKTARVTVESQPGKVYTGKVSRVDKLARPRVRGVPVQYFGMTVTLDKMDPLFMKPGARIRAVLEVDKAPNAIAVPRQAIFEKDGKRIVHVRNGRGFKAVEVKTGTASAGRVVINSGIKAGDVIAISDPEATGGKSS